MAEEEPWPPPQAPEPPPPTPQAWPPAPAPYAGTPYIAPPVNSGAVLALGVGGLVVVLSGVLCFLGGLVGGGLGVAAWITGNGALATLRRVGDPLAQRGTVEAGRVCGIIAVILATLGLVVGMGILAIGLMTPPSG